MRTHQVVLCLWAFLPLGQNLSHAQSSWPQFRGPHSQGVGAGASAPSQFGLATNLLWKTALPSGHSSPCIWGDRIFLTGFENGKLETLCLDRREGKVRWRVAAPTEKIEPVHRIGSPASPTPATDGERVVVYFGSFGLISYDFAGRELWRKPLPKKLRVTSYN